MPELAKTANHLCPLLANLSTARRPKFELLQSGRHAREGGLQASSRGLHGRDDCNRDTRCNQTVLDSRRPGLVLPELSEIFGHHSPLWLLRSPSWWPYGLRMPGETLRTSECAIRKSNRRDSLKRSIA